MGRRQQRLRHIGRLAGDDAHPLAMRGVIEEHHRARGTLARDLDPGDLVQELGRHVENRLRLARIGLGEAEGPFSHGTALGIEGAHRTRLAPIPAGAHDRDRKTLGIVRGAGKRERSGDVRVHQGDVMAAQGLDESRCVRILREYPRRR